MQRGFAYTRLADRLTSIAELSDDDIEVLASMPYSIAHFASHEQVLHRSDRPACCTLLLQGYLCWKDDYYGQITSIHVPGDVPDLRTIVAPRLEARLTALGPAVVASVPHAFFHETSSSSPRLDRAFQLLAHAEASCLRNWIINLGSRDSLTRVAHLICEITMRLKAVGLAKDNRFCSPFTQSDLAAACAISPVHANRVIQELRRRGALQWHSRTIAINDWQALSRIACFDPDYLGLRSRATPMQQQPLSAIAASEIPETSHLR
jgi:CRP-like cAMP-binding protein